MYILAVDSSTKKLSYSIIRDGNPVWEYNQIAGRGASRFVCQLQKTLGKLGLAIDDFGFFIVGAGPGSFTGLRISFSVVKAFALVTKKPAIYPNSFLACAYPFRKKAEKIAVVSDARKDLVYAGFFSSLKKGFRQEAAPKLMRLEDCTREKKDYLFVTQESLSRQKLLSFSKSLKVWHENVYPKATCLFSSLGKIKIKNSNYNLANLKPLYLHPMNCQVRRSF